MPLPDIEWVPLIILNPDRRWWQFWKPKFIHNPENPIAEVLAEHNQILEHLVWIEEHDDAQAQP